MNQEKEETQKEERVIYADGWEAVPCPNLCGQDLMDLDEDFWNAKPPEIRCKKCGQPAEHSGHIHSDLKPSKSLYVFTCASCNLKFTRMIPGMRRRCPSCKETFSMFWKLHLALPPPSSRPRRKAMLQSA